MNKRILLVEDDPFVTRSIQQVLPREYHLDTRKDLTSAYSYLHETRPALVLLDRTLPDGDGIEIAEYLAQSSSVLPVVVISGKTGLHERIDGLRKGADDYLPKPFSTTELFLKVERLLRTTKHLGNNTIVVGQLQLLLDRGQVLVRNHLLRLRKKELEILAFLASQRGRVVSRDQMIDNIWPDGVTPSHSTIDVYVRRLRMMLGEDGKMIKTVKGFGYSL